MVKEPTLNKDKDNNTGTEKLRNLLIIQPRLRVIVRCSRKLIEVPGDGFCGIYALTVMLAHENIYVTAETISHLLDLNLHEKPIWLEGEDISAVADFYNFNLIIILCPNFENSTITVGLGFYKPGKKFPVVFFENNHWTPGCYDKNNDNPNLEVTRVTFTHDSRSLHTSRALLNERKILAAINEIPETDVINNENDLKRANYPLIDLREVKQISLNLNNPKSHSQDRKYTKPYTTFKKVDRSLPDDRDVNSKIKFDINPKLNESQKINLLSLLQKYESVFSKSKKTFNDHLYSLESTLERFKQYNLKLKLSKCKFGYTELKILGNIIDKKGISPTDEGLKAITQSNTIVGMTQGSSSSSSTLNTDCSLASEFRESPLRKRRKTFMNKSIEHRNICSSERTEQIHQALAKMIAINQMPLSFCSSSGFQQFMAIVEPNYLICKEGAIKRRLKAFKSSVEEQIKKRIKKF
ncbi:hypothetical protein QTP88_000347 [Uroleucon formosanum]